MCQRLYSKLIGQSTRYFRGKRKRSGMTMHAMTAYSGLFFFVSWFILTSTSVSTYYRAIKDISWPKRSACVAQNQDHQQPVYHVVDRCIAFWAHRNYACRSEWKKEISNRLHGAYQASPNKAMHHCLSRHASARYTFDHWPYSKFVWQRRLALKRPLQSALSTYSLLLFSQYPSYGLQR